MIICSCAQRICFLPGNSYVLFDEFVLWHNHVLIKTSIFSSMFSCCYLQDVLSISMQPRAMAAPSSLYTLTRAVIHHLISLSSFSLCWITSPDQTLYFWQEGFRVSKMNTQFGDELKKGVKGLWASLFPYMNSSVTSGVDSMYVPLHNKYEWGSLS